MERHIDLDSAMIAHLEESGYTVIKNDEADVDGLPDTVPDLFKRAIEREREADRQYADAWDVLSNVGLSEIVLMKAARVKAAIANNDEETAEDSLVDLCNYAAKLYDGIEPAGEAE